MSDIKIIEDNLGRKIAIKKPSTLERVNFFRAVGAADCNNPMVLMELSNAMWVQSIDSNPMPKKQMVDIEFIINELDKSNASELISRHRIELFEQQQAEEGKEIETVKK